MTEGYVGVNLGSNEDEPQPTGDLFSACPDCGEPGTEFMVDAPNAEIAERVFVAYYATKNIPVEVLRAVLDGIQHLHIVGGTVDDCNDSQTPNT